MEIRNFSGNHVAPHVAKLGGNPNSHTSAHESSAAVASFRTWPSSQSIIARGPKGSP